MITIYPFCELADVQARLSAEGTRLRVDDNPADTADAFISATVEVLGYTQLLYSIAALQNSNWIKFKTRDIAVFFLCGRRGNPVPGSVRERYDKAIADLEKVQSGIVILPDAPMSKAAVPVMANLHIQMWPIPHPVAVEGTSTGRTSGYVRHVDRLDMIDYSI